MDPMGMNKASGILKNQGDMDQFMDKDFEETDSWICRGFLRYFSSVRLEQKWGNLLGW